MKHKHQSFLVAYVVTPWKIENGKLTAPVTIVTQGVHEGSMGAIYWAPHILEQSAHLWENVPVCINHPLADGLPVSINHNSETKNTIIGIVTKPFYDSIKKAIKATIEVPANHPQAAEIQGIREVSMGIFSDEIYESGEWKGESYLACALSMQPDHLAILPNEEGACNFEKDGCGIRNNSQSKAFEEIVREAAQKHFQNLIQGDHKMKTNEVKPLLPPGVKEEKKSQSRKWYGPGVEPMLPPGFDRSYAPELETKNQKPTGGADEVEPMLPAIFNR